MTKTSSQEPGKDITACLVIIGNEILSGRTRDANLEIIGRRCDRLGITLLETRIIPDDEETIVDTVNDCRKRFTYVFTTGGIGPTHDDITSASIARAFGVSLERNPDAVRAMDDYYEPGKLTDARLKMADVPAGARLIDNPVSAAPGFQLENVFVLPGVPMIMEVMLESLDDRLIGGDPVLTRSVATNLAESIIAPGLGELQTSYPEISIGSYPWFRNNRLGVNVVMRSTNEALIDKLTADLKQLIAGLGGEIIIPDPG